jgi:hypothetical protein
MRQRVGRWRQPVAVVVLESTADSKGMAQRLPLNWMGWSAAHHRKGSGRSTVRQAWNAQTVTTFEAIRQRTSNLSWNRACVRYPKHYGQAIAESRAMLLAQPQIYAAWRISATSTP